MPSLPTLIGVVILGLAIGVAIGLRRRRSQEETESKALSETELAEITADLAEAREAKDAPRIQALEDRLRIHEYWVKKEAGVDLPDRIQKTPTAISDWKTAEKRFNNLR